MRPSPPWLRRRFSPDGTRQLVRGLVEELGLATVCEEARCPNLPECFGQRQLTFMILGDRCTRTCRFCAVTPGRPLAVSADEPDRVGEAVHRLGLRHVVITSVARDDLADEGAGQFVRVIRQVRRRNPGASVEVLVPDFHAKVSLIHQVMDEVPEVFCHNLETVERLTPVVRPQGRYQRSLETLTVASARAERSLVKSGLMVGFGESPQEVERALLDLRQAGCTHLTLGQYLRPTAGHLPVMEYVSPVRFEEYEVLAYEAGFSWVSAGPFVRSSYHAVDALRAGASPRSTRSTVHVD